MMKFVMILVCLAAIDLSGCMPAAKEEVLSLSNDVDDLMVKVDDYQAKYLEEVDLIQDRIVVVNNAIKEKADQGFVEQLSAGIEASRPFNPYADEMNAILLLTGTIGAILGKKKLNAVSREANRVEAKRQADKVGREKTLLELAAVSDESITSAMVSNMMFDNIGEARARNGI